MSSLEERNYCVYKHTSPSGKVYIGLTGQNIISILHVFSCELYGLRKYKKTNKGG